MRTTFNFSPLYRSSIGFDRVFNLLEKASRPQTNESWPPYNIARTCEDAYRVSIAVAGFAESDLDLTLDDRQRRGGSLASGAASPHRPFAGRTNT